MRDLGIIDHNFPTVGPMLSKSLSAISANISKAFEGSSGVVLRPTEVNIDDGDQVQSDDDDEVHQLQEQSTH